MFTQARAHLSGTDWSRFCISLSLCFWQWQRRVKLPARIPRKRGTESVVNLVGEREWHWGTIQASREQRIIALSYPAGDSGKGANRNSALTVPDDREMKVRKNVRGKNSSNPSHLRLSHKWFRGNFTLFMQQKQRRNVTVFLFLHLTRRWYGLRVKYEISSLWYW